MFDDFEWPDEPDLKWKVAKAEADADLEVIDTVFENGEEILIVSDSEGNGTKVIVDDESSEYRGDH